MSATLAESKASLPDHPLLSFGTGNGTKDFMYARSESAIEPRPSLIKDTFCNNEIYKVIVLHPAVFGAPSFVGVHPKILYGHLNP